MGGRLPIMPAMMDAGAREAVIQIAESIQEKRLQVPEGVQQSASLLLMAVAHILSLEERNRNLSEAFRRMENLADWRGEAVSEIDQLLTEDWRDAGGILETRISSIIAALETRIEKGDKP